MTKAIFYVPSTFKSNYFQEQADRFVCKSINKSFAFAMEMFWTKSLISFSEHKLFNSRMSFARQIFSRLLLLGFIYPQS